ncbi:PhnD/SsuA/transferrin family substrate-binding protein [Thermoleptolyngbya sp. C42_A2020_037]|uniref:phosphate/phosphite/phosphonate ABC transporter substrate-binding protein n=1 Tax=Thermoleptolyngbya sp. C42_A2020_037 TaxID=2747799 RepID=UPI0019FB9EF7|nr:PhnD/SsuA/transferrin family substrate-binding protein [Thermoleptolyngbya sp. C42_A2020_037]MBF2085317.1 PhnD/SsuA/transferrin family substrate-binding protein [Thermoleptolyngbya sp. C42_A2020_037]
MNTLSRRTLLRLSGRALLTQSMIGLLSACDGRDSSTATKLDKLTVGVVTYGEGAKSIDQYQPFLDYLQAQTKMLAELEPAYNEVKAVEQLQRQAWSLAFAPPGLAAIALSRAQYLPLFPLEGVNNLSSVLVVRDDSPIQDLSDVNKRIVALGQPGSATGYYVPLYELYGTTPSEVRIASTPATVMEWLANQEADLGALARDEFDRLRPQFSPATFRIVRASRRIPSGSVLISPAIDRNQQAVIQKAMSEVLPTIAQQVGYIPNAAPPDYTTLIEFIEKVRPIEAHISEKPARLYE